MTSPSADKRSSGIPVVAGILMILWLAHWLPFFFPRARLWGINHLLFVPPWGQILFVIGGLVIALLCIPKIRSAAGSYYEKAARALFSDRPRALWAIVALASVAVFWFLRPSLFWLGDSYAVPVNVGNDIPTIFKWSEVGAVFIANFIARLFPQQDATVGRLVYAMIAVISGGVSVYILFVLARLLARDVQKRLVLWSVMVFGAWLLLFFGYTENYPILWPFIIAYIYFSISYLQRRNGLLVPLLFLVLSAVMHLQTLFFAPSFLVLLFARGRMAKFYHNNRSLIWAAMCVIFAAGIYNLARLYMQSIEFRLFIVPFLDGRPPAGEYSLFSIPHIVDCLNLLLLTSPLIVFFVFVSGKWSRPFFRSKEDTFLALLTIGGLAFLCLIDPKLGMGRDWDLFALAGFLPLVWLAVRAVPGISTRWYPAITVAAIVFAMPFITTHLLAKPARANIKYLFSLDMARARTGMYMLKEYYADQGMSKKADSLDSVMRHSFPEYTLVPTAYSLLESGDAKNAWRLADSVSRVNPYSNEVLVLRGNILLQSGQFSKAIPDFELAAALGQYDARILTSLGSAYGHTRETEKAFDYFRRALALNPEHWEAYEGMAIIYYEVGKYDSSLKCAEKYIAEDGSNPEAIMLAGFCAYQLRQNTLARRYFERFLAVSPNSSYRERVENTLATIR